MSKHAHSKNSINIVVEIDELPQVMAAWNAPETPRTSEPLANLTLYFDCDAARVRAVGRYFLHGRLVVLVTSFALLLALGLRSNVLEKRIRR